MRLLTVNFNSNMYYLIMADLNERLQAVEEQLKFLTKSSESESKKAKMGKEKKPKGTREPTEYNKFMSNFIKEQKEELGDKFNHKIAFGDGAKKWKEHKESK